ncbi:MAG: PilN domain-containing protein [Phycisphaerales bacterium]|nr:PilN domain-containing protein [Phycisphaerales bacterium]
MNGVNLIPAHRTLARRRRARVRLWTIAAATHAVLLGAVYAGMAAAWGGTSAEWKGRLASINSQLDRDNDALKARQADLTEKLAAKQANDAVGEQADWSMLLGLIARTVRDDVVLENSSLRPGDPGAKPARPLTLALSGLGRTHGAVSDFVLRLESTRVFSHVALLETRRTALPHAEAIAFRVEAAISEDARR